MFKKIDYRKLNPREQEAYNFQKVSALLADYGYITIKLSSDWQGADFIAQHKDGNFLKVQLKGRLVVAQKYENKNLHICFFNAKNQKWYLVPHDEALKFVMENVKKPTNKTWAEKKQVDYGAPSAKFFNYFKKYAVPPFEL